MKKLFSSLKLLILCFIVNNSFAQDNYDVGVFYMPWWHSNDVDTSNPGPEPFFYWPGSPIPDSTYQTHHWSIVGDFDAYLSSQYKWSQRREPLNIYYLPGTGTGDVQRDTTYGPAGWYNENLPEVTSRQLKEMSDHSIDFVIYDSYFEWSNHTNSYTPIWTGVIDNWFKINQYNQRVPNTEMNTHGVKYALMWADRFTSMVNGDATIGSSYNDCNAFFDSNNPNSGLNKMIDHWAKYMAHPSYKKINNRPVFYIYYPGAGSDPQFNGYSNSVEGMCAKCGTHSFFNGINEAPGDYMANNKTKRLLTYINSRIKNINGITDNLYFVAVLSPMGLTYDIKWDWMVKHTDIAGYDATTAYGHKWFNEADRDNTSYNYSTMQRVYRDFHNYMLTQDYPTSPNRLLKYHVPVLSGFNNAPTNYRNCLAGNCPSGPYAPGPSNDYKYNNFDNAISTATSFRQSLVDAKYYKDNYPGRTDNVIAICCWNEYSEGSFIEPTMERGRTYIQQVQNVFPNSSTGGRFGPNSDEDAVEISTEELFTNFLNIYPNPVEGSSTINFSLANEGNVEIRIINNAGQTVEVVSSKYRQKGNYKIEWNAFGYPKGIYFCEIKSAGFEETKKMIVH